MSGSILEALRRICAASRCCFAVSMISRMMRRCRVMRIPRLNNAVCSAPGASVCGIGIVEPCCSRLQLSCKQIFLNCLTPLLSMVPNNYVTVATQLQLLRWTSLYTSTKAALFAKRSIHDGFTPMGNNITPGLVSLSVRRSCDAVSPQVPSSGISLFCHLLPGNGGTREPRHRDVQRGGQSSRRRQLHRV